MRSRRRRRVWHCARARSVPRSAVRRIQDRVRGVQLVLQASHFRLERAHLRIQRVAFTRLCAALLRGQLPKRTLAPRLAPSRQMGAVQPLAAKQPTHLAGLRTALRLLEDPQPILRGELRTLVSRSCWQRGIRSLQTEPSCASGDVERVEQALDVLFVVVDVHGGPQEAVLLADDDALLPELAHGLTGMAAEIDGHDAGPFLPGDRCAHPELAPLRLLDQPGGQLPDTRLDGAQANLADESRRTLLHPAPEKIRIAVFEAVRIMRELQRGLAPIVRCE